MACCKLSLLCDALSFTNSFSSSSYHSLPHSSLANHFRSVLSLSSVISALPRFDNPPPPLHHFNDWPPPLNPTNHHAPLLITTTSFQLGPNCRPGSRWSTFCWAKVDFSLQNNSHIFIYSYLHLLIEMPLTTTNPAAVPQPCNSLL